MTQKYEEVSIRWEKGHRYYEAHVMEDLYGWVFVRTWGKKDTRLGRSMRVRVNSCEEGLKAMKEVKKRREYRGYELVEVPGKESQTCNRCSGEFVKPAVQLHIEGR